MRKKHFALLLLCSHYTWAQQTNFKIPDSLHGKSYDYLSHGFLISKEDSLKALPYAQTWLQKAKKENNALQMVGAYKALLHKAPKKSRLQYADSMIIASKRSNDNALIGSAYLTRGIVSYNSTEPIKALNDYLTANEYISKTKDQYLIYKVKYLIAQTKYYLGFYQEAIALLQECIVYFKNENDRAHLNALHLIALCYNSINKYDWCSATNSKGLRLADEYEIEEMTPYFKQSEGVNQFYKHNYTTAINLLTEAIPAMVAFDDSPNEMVANFYIGKSYWSLQQPEKAIPFLKKVDTAFVTKNYIRPDLRGNYELLINFYKKQKDQATQLVYINRLLKVDSLLNSNYKYLSGKIFKAYDTKKLLQDKAEIQQAMKTQKEIGLGIIAMLTLSTAFLVQRQVKNRKLYKQKFEAFMLQKPSSVKPLASKTYLESELNLNPEVTDTILKNLEKFEKNHKYLEKDMNLVKLAAILNTNQKYVTKIIAHYRNKKTIEYVSDLKIDYIIDRLKTQSKYRNYTNKALGEEAGFGSTQIFTKTFRNRVGMPPTFFINELKKATATENLQ